MTATVVKSIGTGAGRDYASISAWVAARVTSKDVTATGSDTVEVGEVYFDGVITEASTVTVAAGTIDASHPITLRAASNQSFRDNSSNALTYDETKGVAVRLGATTGASLALGAFVTVEGLQFKVTGATTGSMVTFSSSTVAQDCVLDSGARNGSTAMLPFTASGSSIRRCLIVQRQPSMPTLSGATTALTPLLEGCTVLYPTAATTAVVISGGGANFKGTVRNNVFVTGNSACKLFTTAGDTNVGTNGGDITFNQGTGVALTSAAFVNSTGSGGTYDMRLNAGSAAMGAGVASATDLVDVFRTTRPSPPALGMHQYVAAGGRRWRRIPLGAIQ